MLSWTLKVDAPWKQNVTLHPVVGEFDCTFDFSVLSIDDFTRHFQIRPIDPKLFGNQSIRGVHEFQNVVSPLSLNSFFD